MVAKEGHIAYDLPIPQFPAKGSAELFVNRLQTAMLVLNSSLMPSIINP